jgi:RNA recognition motif-containing protein
MNKSLFVAGLDFGMNEQELKECFASFGTVVSAKIVTDRATGKSRGFGFVDMSNADEAQACINGLNNTNIKGRTIAVRFKEERARSFSGTDNRRGY